jgi:hypothetical protein
MRGWERETARAAVGWSMVALLGVTLAACSNESGVLVEITRNSATTPEGIERLELVVGVESADHPETYLVDGSSITDADVSGRELATSPFQLLVHKGARADARLMVAVIAYKGADAVGFAAFAAPQAFIDGQVLMRRLTLEKRADAAGRLPGCITWVDGEVPHQIAASDDQDCDGDLAPADCDDHDPAINHSATEICANGIDENCVDGVDEVTDNDGDGVKNCEGDCNDNLASVHPGAPELCDGEDNDCNGRCDDGVLDEDDDSYNTCGERIRMNGQCVPADVPDCDDHDAAVHPGATETCNGKDDDCEGSCDVAPGSIDRDGDKVTACGTIPGATCVGPRDQLRDCDDDNSVVHPGATEICDGKDDDCNGVIETTEPCYATVGGLCRVGVRQCDDDDSDHLSGLQPGCLTADNGPVVSPGFCTAYEECEAATSQTPFTCANDTQASHNQRLDCTLLVKPDLSLCPELRTPLPIGPVSVNCHWVILGGVQQAHYQVGLFDGNGAGGAQVAIDTCTGSFGVVDNLDFVPHADKIYLGYRDDTVGPSAVQVSITPMLTAQCPAGGGLQCTLVPPMAGP